MLRPIFLFLFILSISAKAQTDSDEVYRIISKIPELNTLSIASIADYVQSNFKSDSHKLKAIFYFTTQHIDYDVDNMYAINFNETTEQKIEKGLTARVGVCMHYAEVFNALARKLGFESYVVEGMTKQNGSPDGMAHAWNATKLEGKWYLFDPTWAAGAVYQGQFIRKFDVQYYKVKPEKWVKSHYPFDCLWQFSSYPLKANDFLFARSSSQKTKFDYEKILKELPRLSEQERLYAAIERIEANGLSHGLIFNRYTYLKQMATVVPYNEAVADYNEAVKQFNAYIHFRNAKFTPSKSDTEILQMITTPKQLAELAALKLNSMKNIDKTMGIQPESLLASIQDLEKNIREQEVFVKEYIETKPAKRSSLFYQKTVSIFRIPVKK